MISFLLFILVVKSCAPGNTVCTPDQVCYKGIGCVAVASLSKEIVDCYGLCINKTSTPTLRCSSVPCPSNPNSQCPRVSDSLACFKEPIIPENGGCVKQGVPVVCLSSFQCQEPQGCLFLTESSTAAVIRVNDDQTWLIAFFIIFATVVLLLLLGIGFFSSR